MGLHDYFEKINRIDQFVRMRATGNPVEFSKKLGIAKSTLYLYINTMKLFDAPIEYNKEQKTFFYTRKGNLKIGFITEELTENESKNIKGGDITENFLYFFVSPMTSD